eukprot:Selendium_serpulae@DN6088_c0_g1_i4.p1
MTSLNRSTLVLRSQARQESAYPKRSTRRGRNQHSQNTPHTTTRDGIADKRFCKPDPACQGHNRDKTARSADSRAGIPGSPKIVSSGSNHDYLLAKGDAFGGWIVPANFVPLVASSFGELGISSDFCYRPTPSHGHLTETPVKWSCRNHADCQMVSSPQLRSDGELTAMQRSSREYIWPSHPPSMVVSPSARWAYNLSSFHICTTPIFGGPRASSSQSSIDQFPYLLSRGTSQGDVAENVNSSMYASTRCISQPLHADRSTSADNVKQEDELVCQHFSLLALWESLEEASTFGVEVPSIDADAASSHVVYIPYLSALRLTEKTSSGVEYDSKEKSSCTTKRTRVSNGSAGEPTAFHYVDTRPPYLRHPLTETIELLRTGHNLNEGATNQTYSEAQRKLLEVDTNMLDEDSWMAIYWQPVHTAVWRNSGTGTAPIFLVCYSLAGAAVPMRNVQQSSVWLSSDTRNSETRGSCADHLPRLWTGRASILRKRIESQTIDCSKQNPLIISLTDESRLISFATVPCHADASSWTIGTEGEKQDEIASFFEESNDLLQEWLQQKNVTLPDFDWITRGQLKTKRSSVIPMRGHNRR